MAEDTNRNQRPGRTISFTIPTVNHSFGNWRQLWLRRLVRVGIAFLLLVFLAGYAGTELALHQNNPSNLLNTSSLGSKKIVTSQSQLISRIASAANPSVVSVNVTIDATSSPNNTDYSFFGLGQQSQAVQAAGTGIIITSGGIIMTNRHVVPVGTTQVSVTLSDGTELKDVSVIGRTSSTDNLDVAFLKVNNADSHKLTPIAIGNSDDVQVGDDVIAIGNALGQFQNTVTQGIVSGYGRSVQASDSSNASSAESLSNLFQTDAAINEGNSGGPLMNLNGQVIGMNTATAGNAQNIGFAIPINDLRGLINQVLKTGKFQRAYLGVHYVSLNAAAASQYGLKTLVGAYIPPSSDQANPSIVSGSPADSAGLQDHDIITAVDTTNIDQRHDLTSLLAQHQPGDTIKLTIKRGDQTLTASVTLGVQPGANQ